MSQQEQIYTVDMSQLMDVPEIAAVTTIAIMDVAMAVDTAAPVLTQAAHQTNAQPLPKQTALHLCLAGVNASIYRVDSSVITV